MGKVSDISKGSFVKYNGELSIVLEYEHRTPGNLRAFYQVKMRNLKSGRLIEQRFRPDDEMELVRIHFKEHQFLYLDGNNVVVMDNETFDQIHYNHIVAIKIQKLVFLEMNPDKFHLIIRTEALFNQSS